MSLIGIMWLDTSTEKPFADKVKEGVEHFKEKFGRSPSVVMVHPQLVGEGLEIQGIPVKPQREVLLHHFFIMEEEGGNGAES